jgi:putative ABC transport system ATP-binding protein
MQTKVQQASDVVKVNNLSYYFGTGELQKKVLDKVSFKIAPGEIVILMGPSGSGKTTFLTLIGALRKAIEGEIRVLGKDLVGVDEKILIETRKNIGYIFQQHNLLQFLTVEQNVSMGLELHKMDAAKARSEARLFLEEVGLSDYYAKYPDQLSGGQQQRVAIARALAPAPLLVLADEPTAALDKKTGREVVDLMLNLAKKKGSSIILVTHDNRILDIADRIVHMEDGRIMENSRGGRNTA